MKNYTALIVKCFPLGIHPYSYTADYQQIGDFGVDSR